jgi:hypothetical protein
MLCVSTVLVFNLLAEPPVLHDRLHDEAPGNLLLLSRPRSSDGSLLPNRQWSSWECAVSVVTSMSLRDDCLLFIVAAHLLTLFHLDF